MVSLIDANVLIRYLLGDHPEHAEKSCEIFKQIEQGELEVEILSAVLMEVYFVLVKFYKLPSSEVIGDLITILSFEGVVNSDKVILTETLHCMESKKIDFVDALICTKSRMQGYEKISFDQDVKEC